MTTLSRLLGVGLCVAIFVAVAAPAHAQYGPTNPAYGTGAIPSSPISPYLQLFNRNGTSVNPYTQFVVPAQDYQAELDRNRAFQQATQASLQQGPAQITNPGIRPTGGYGGYMNYLHFYPPEGQTVGAMLPNVGGGPALTRREGSGSRIQT